MDHDVLIRHLLPAKLCRSVYVEAARRGVTARELVIEGIVVTQGMTGWLNAHPAVGLEQSEDLADHDVLIHRLVDTPEPDRDLLEAARSQPGFFDSFMRYILPVIDSTPAQGLSLLDVARRIVTDACDLVLVIGLQGYVCRLLGAPDRELRKMELAAFLAGDCRSCHAHLRRRRARTHAVLGEPLSALAEADASIRLYKALQGQPNHHDVFGNGLAWAFVARGDVRHCLGIESEDPNLLSGAVADLATVLDLVDPNDSPKLYRLALFNLCMALHATGRREDLELADRHLTTARRLFKGSERRTTERARLGWGTAMVRYELGKVRPARILKMLDESLATFLYLGMPFEAAAVAADRMRLVYPDQSSIAQWISEVSSRLEERLGQLRQYEPAMWKKLGDVEPLRRALGWVREAALHCDGEVVRDTIEDLREACGSGMLKCLIRWREA